MLSPDAQPGNQAVIVPSDVLDDVVEQEQSTYYIHKSGAGALLTEDHIRSSGGDYSIDDYRLATAAEVAM